MIPIAPSASLVEITTDRVRSAIIRGEFGLGEKLSEQRLAAMLNVSRSPVHEALVKLQEEGLVEITPKVGTFVFSPDYKSSHDLCAHRALLEGACVKVAISDNHAALMDGLRSHLAGMEEAIVQDDTVAYMVADMGFHDAIVSCSTNRSILRAYSRIISPVMALRTHVFNVINQTPEQSMAEHVQILEHCNARDAEAAATVLHDHVFNLLHIYQAAMPRGDADATVTR